MVCGFSPREGVTVETETPHEVDEPVRAERRPSLGLAWRHQGVGSRQGASGRAPKRVIFPDGDAPPPRRRWRYVGAGALAALVVAGVVWMLPPVAPIEPGPTAVVPAPPPAPPPPPPVPSARADAAPPASPATPAPTAAPSPRARAPGRLWIGATPWGQVYVDDKLIGNSPIVGLAVPAGLHHLRIVRDGFEPFERTIQVAAGAELRLTGLVLRELRP